MNHVDNLAKNSKPAERVIDADTITMPEYLAMIDFVQNGMMERFNQFHKLNGEFNITGIIEPEKHTDEAFITSDVNPVLFQSVSRAFSSKEKPHHPKTYTELKARLNDNWQAVEAHIRETKPSVGMQQIVELHEVYKAIGEDAIKLGKRCDPKQAVSAER